MLSFCKHSIAVLAVSGAFAVGAAEAPSFFKVVPPAVFALKQDCPAPETVDAAALRSAPRNGVPRNIIYIIGDGMGQGAIRYAGTYAHGKPQTLVMEQFPVTGMAITVSADNAVTDSAASGTALSSGYKTNNRMLGMTPQKIAVRSIAEEARDSGRAVGIMTSDKLTGATPGAFMAHVLHRSQAADIAEAALNSRYDLLIGDGIADFLPEKMEGARKDNRDLIAEFTAKGYAKIDGVDAFQRAPKQPVFGFIRNWTEDVTLLSRLAAEAFRRLAEKPEGFFIMIEGCQSDFGGHGNNPDLSIRGTLMVDFTVKAALDFAAARKDTLIVITADHETGGLYTMANTENPRRPHVYYTSKNHTGVPVNIYAYGPGAENFAGVLDNTEIPTRMASLWKLPLLRPVNKE